VPNIVYPGLLDEIARRGVKRPLSSSVEDEHRFGGPQRVHPSLATTESLQMKKGVPLGDQLLQFLQKIGQRERASFF